MTARIIVQSLTIEPLFHRSAPLLVCSAFVCVPNPRWLLQDAVCWVRGRGALRLEARAIRFFTR